MELQRFSGSIVWLLRLTRVNVKRSEENEGRKKRKRSRRKKRKMKKKKRRRKRNRRKMKHKRRKRRRKRKRMRRKKKKRKMKMKKKQKMKKKKRRRKRNRRKIAGRRRRGGGGGRIRRSQLNFHSWAARPYSLTSSCFGRMSKSRYGDLINVVWVVVDLSVWGVVCSSRLLLRWLMGWWTELAAVWNYRALDVTGECGQQGNEHVSAEGQCDVSH